MPLLTAGLTDNPPLSLLRSERYLGSHDSRRHNDVGVASYHSGRSEEAAGPALQQAQGDELY